MGYTYARPIQVTLALVGIGLTTIISYVSLFTSCTYRPVNHVHKLTDHEPRRSAAAGKSFVGSTAHGRKHLALEDTVYPLPKVVDAFGLD